MDAWQDAGRQRTQCAVKRRAAQLARYHANPAPQNYARGRYLKLQRMRAKEARVAELEDSLAREV